MVIYFFTNVTMNSTHCNTSRFSSGGRKAFALYASVHHEHALVVVCALILDLHFSTFAHISLIGMRRTFGKGSPATALATRVPRLGIALFLNVSSRHPGVDYS